MDAECTIKISRHHGCINASGIAVDGRVHSIFFERDQILKLFVVLAQLLVNGVRKYRSRGAAARRQIEISPHARDGFVAIPIPAQHAQLFRMGNVESIVEQLLADREDGGISADSEREGGCGNQGERWALRQDANSIANVGSEFIEPAKPQRCAHIFLVGECGAKRDAGAASGLGGRVAGTHKVIGELLEMKLKLGFHLRLKPAAVEDGAQPGTELRVLANYKFEQLHTFSGVVRRIPAMMPAMRFHFSVSASRRRLPAAVSR